jgi:hypothetical protein
MRRTGLAILGMAAVDLIMEAVGKVLKSYPMIPGMLKIFSSHPLLAWLSLAVLAYGGYYGGRWVSYAPLHLALTGLSGLVYAVCILFSPFFIYLADYLRGRSRQARLLSAGAIPFLWMTKDVLVLTTSHPLLECLYWYINPMFIFYSCLLCIEIGLAVLLGRGLLSRRGEEQDMVSPAAVALIGAAALVMITIYNWGQGENLHSIYLEGYRHIFGGRW